MKKITLILITLLLIGIVSCNEENNTRDNKLFWDVQKQYTIEKNVKKVIMKDVLGAAILSTVFRDDIYVDEADDYIEFVFPSPTGEGSVTISTNNKPSEFVPEKDSNIIDIPSMDLMITYDQFTTNSDCALNATISGSIDCNIDGEYIIDSGIFEGRAICATGNVSRPVNIDYQTPTDKYQVRMFTNIRIDGDPFDLNSYSYRGSFFINNRMTIPEVSIAPIDCRETN